MEPDLLGYLWKLQDSDDRQAIGSALNHDPHLRAKMDRLARSVAPLALADDEAAPPPGLADRTLSRIDLISATTTPSRWEFGSAMVRSRWELAVSLCVMFAAGGLAVLGIERLTRSSHHAACIDNLRAFHEGLTSYAADHGGSYPELRTVRGKRRAGTFYGILKDSGRLPPRASPDCPAAHHARRHHHAHATDYLYSLGFRDSEGVVRPPRLVSGSEDESIPVVSDRPPAHWVGRPSTANHSDGCNVLYLNGSVRTARNPYCGRAGEHAFENDSKRIAAGLHPFDSVLGDYDDTP
jgi:hypothetical protein